VIFVAMVAQILPKQLRGGVTVELVSKPGEVRPGRGKASWLHGCPLAWEEKNIERYQISEETAEVTACNRNETLSLESS